MSALVAHLIERAILTTADVARAQDVCLRANIRMTTALARLGLVSEGDIADSLAASSGFSRFRRELLLETRPAIKGINTRFLRRYMAAPIAFGESSLTFAMVDPEDDSVLSALKFASGEHEFVPVVATAAEVEELLGPIVDEFDDQADMFDPGSGAEEDFERLVEGESDAPVIRLVQRLLANAVNRRASDVHIEPMARYMSVRYRIDGRLVDVEQHSDALSGPVASRIKVMAGLDIAESRLPQDGRLRLTVRGRDVDVRVSTSPITYGESVVMRLLGQSEVPLDLDKLGLPSLALERLYRALDRPHGIILLTGPTGSGKTTTLYAAVNRLRRPEVKILTVEDPVEVLLEGVNQVQVRPEIDLTYAATLRAFLRQDPDILMIGEIRDHETAEIAMRAALTGHLVLSTLHTNSAMGAFTRLADIGIEPYLTASTVIATIAQRLIRTLCPDCAVERAPEPAEAILMRDHDIALPATIRDAAGCMHCQDTGYRGRMPLIEIIEVDELLRAAVRDSATEQMVDRRPASETLLGHGLALVAAGRTTISEVRRAVALI
jgi:general secretion pathway protein E